MLAPADEEAPAALAETPGPTLGGASILGEPICALGGMRPERLKRDSSVPPDPCSGSGVSASAKTANGEMPGPLCCTTCIGRTEPGAVASTSAGLAVVRCGDMPARAKR